MTGATGGKTDPEAGGIGIPGFFAGLPRQFPGSEADTLAALGQLPSLPPSACVAEFACGTGAATLALAARLEAPVLALDPSADFLARLRERAAARGLGDRIEPVVGDLANPPVPDSFLDLLWCEGAAYILGFDAALVRWRACLRPTGFAVVSECSWLVPNPGLQARTFWYAAYPAMRTVLENIERAEGAGYELLATHILPPDRWAAWADSLEGRLDALAARGETLDPAFVRALAREIALYRNTGEEFSAVYYVLARK